MISKEAVKRGYNRGNYTVGAPTQPRFAQGLGPVSGEPVFSANPVPVPTEIIERLEALSDRVVVMSPRPGRITDVVEVGLGHDRDDDTREDESFYKMITEVREALRREGHDSTIDPEIEPVVADADPSADTPPVRGIEDR